jgi:hypothetical protein
VKERKVKSLNVVKESVAKAKNHQVRNVVNSSHQ